MVKHEFTMKVFRLNFFNSELSVKQIMMAELNNRIIMLRGTAKKMGLKIITGTSKSNLIRTYTQRT